MARRKKKTHKTHHRRRGVGAVNLKGTAMAVVEIAAGAFVARTLYNFATKTFPTVDPKWIGIGTVGVGMMLPKFVKMQAAVNVGHGMTAIGSLTALQNFGLISGVPGRRVPSRIVGNYNMKAPAFGAAKQNYLQANVSGMGAVNAMSRSMNAAFGSLGGFGGMGALHLQE
jgi:hypothetical protein